MGVGANQNFLKVKLQGIPTIGTHFKNNKNFVVFEEPKPKV